MDEIPPLVERARAVARRIGFPLTRQEAGPGRPTACLPGVGRFLGVLAAGCRAGRIGEIGTGAGVGAAWMASAMPADCVLITVEINPQLAAAASRLLAVDPRVEVLAGDAREVLASRGPFDMLFADGGWRDPAGLATLVDLVRVGGRVVMDDVTPALARPPDRRRPSPTSSGSSSSATRASSRPRSFCPICVTRCWSGRGAARRAPRAGPPPGGRGRECS
jgi:predicted O-methyltransferase YrrM